MPTTVDLEVRLREAYGRHFTRHKRQPTRAMGWPATVWLIQSLDYWQADTVLECGSGWSTTALRLWQDAAPGRYVTTTDHKPAWLQLAHMECVMEGLPAERFAVHDDLSRTLAFDVVFVDLADTPTRFSRIAEFVAWVKPGGWLVLDDWHVGAYAASVSQWMAERGWRAPVKVVATTDEWGRYCAVWRRPAD